MNKLRKGWEWFKAYIRANRVNVYKAVVGVLVPLIPVTDRIPAPAQPFATKLFVATLRNGIDWVEGRPNNREKFGLALAVGSLIVALIAAINMAGPAFYLALSRINTVASILFVFFNMPSTVNGLSTQQPVGEMKNVN